MPRTKKSPYRRPYRPHRGGLILTIGIVGMFSCFIFGLAGWAMATRDLEEMQAGRMDPAGRELTRTGGLISMAGVALQLSAVVFWVIYYLAMRTG
jgi:hypothetical protein